jgi:hypothetical protein
MHTIGTRFFATFMIFALAVACTNTKFSGETKKSRSPGSDAVPDNSDGNPNSDDNNVDPNSGDPNSNKDQNGDIEEGDSGTASVPKAPLIVHYDLQEATDNSNYKNGAYKFSLKRSGSSKTIPLQTFTAGAVGQASFEDLCRCEQTNEFELWIDAAGSNKSLHSGWKMEAMAAHSRPSADCSESDKKCWNYTLSKYNASLGDSQSTIFFGGFDSIFLFGDSCGAFACDEREWNNRDNVRLVFMCEVSKCPNKEKNLKLKFKGQDD